MNRRELLRAGAAIGLAGAGGIAAFPGRLFAGQQTPAAEPVAAPPAAGTFMMCPPTPSFHVTYPTQAPSGDHWGWNSPTSASVSLRASPSGSALTQRRSKAVNAMEPPSGEITGLRI